MTGRKLPRDGRTETPIQVQKPGSSSDGSRSRLLRRRIFARERRKARISGRRGFGMRGFPDSLRQVSFPVRGRPFEDRGPGRKRSRPARVRRGDRPRRARKAPKGEEGSGGREKDSIPAALLGAAYLDAGCPEGFRDGGRAGRLRARKRRFFPRRRDETAGKRRGARKTALRLFHPRRISGATYSRIGNTPTFPLPLRA